MPKAVIVCCEKIRDELCIGCERCFKAIREKLGTFEKFDKIELVGIVGCGGCPGNVIPKMKLFNKWIEGFDDYEIIFIGNCIKAANGFGHCPLDIDDLAELLRRQFNKEVIIGTHPW